MVPDRRDVGVHSVHKKELGGLDPHFHSATSNIYMTVASAVESTPPSTKYATTEYIENKLASLSQSIEQSKSQELKGFLDIIKNNTPMLEEEEYESETEEELDKHYYEHRRRKMKGKVNVKKCQM